MPTGLPSTSRRCDERRGRLSRHAVPRFTVIPAVHLFLVSGGRILLLRRFNTGYEDGKYSVVAGHLDGDEPATQAMAREAAEEAHLVILPDDLILVHVMHRRTPGEPERIDFFFTAPSWQGTPRVMERDRCDELTWWPLEQLPDGVVPYVRAAIDYYRGGVVFSEFGWSGDAPAR
jgi:8-oxo-dGTP diphosphatase